MIVTASNSSRSGRDTSKRSSLMRLGSRLRLRSVSSWRSSCADRVGTQDLAKLFDRLIHPAPQQIRSERATQPCEQDQRRVAEREVLAVVVADVESQEVRRYPVEQIERVAQVPQHPVTRARILAQVRREERDERERHQ